MKLFTDKFTQTLLFNLATIAAIVVATVQFVIRAYNENNGNEKVRKVMQTLLAFVDTLVEHGKVYFAEPAEPAAPAVTVQKVAQKRTKRA
jgi:negative regulator of sigma E activity